jgi:hypothetical protein
VNLAFHSGRGTLLKGVLLVNIKMIVAENIRKRRRKKGLSPVMSG